MPADPRAELKNVRLFSECSKDELREIDRLADTIELEAGTEFVTQGHYGHAAYLVIDGEAAVIRDGEKVGTIGPGGTIGELSVIEPGPRTATVVAETKMTVLAFNSPEFLTAVEDIPALSRSLLRSLAKRLRELDDNPLAC